MDARQVVGKAYGYIVRRDEASETGARRVLVFRHRDYPEAGVQIPKGTIDPPESAEETVLREMEEETGLTNLRLVRKLAVDRVMDYGQVFERHFFLLESDETREAWDHAVTGQGDDTGTVFQLYWIAASQIETLTHGHGDYLPLVFDAAAAADAPPQRGLRLETVAVHAGHSIDAATGAVIPPIHLSTTFERGADGAFAHGHVYVRNSNPNRDALEASLAALEGGAAAAAFSSGQAAIMTVMQALSPGDHVIAPLDVYHIAAKLLREVFVPWGLAVSFVDFNDTAQVRATLRPETRLLWVETPSNPLLKITDIAATATLAHDAGARLICDNTWASPMLQRPLALGADLVMHSTTKYLGGHSDLLGGALIARQADAFFERIRLLQATGGAVQSPFDCWLALRGIRTLAHRMRAHTENGMRVAQFLAEHPAVEAVHYPGLATHPGYAIARRQMESFGGMLSFQVRGDATRAMAVAARVKLFTRATSLGGPESLMEHRASVEGAGTRTPGNLLRISIGLEHPNDIIDDLAQALA